jgi:hypothetical protein
LLRASEPGVTSGRLRELTHDLAQVFHFRVSEEAQVPDLLRSVVCLAPASPGSEAKLRVEGCV